MSSATMPPPGPLSVDERQQADEALHASEERFRQLAENIQEVFWLMDIATQKIIYVSPIYEKLWGRTRASLYAAAEPWPNFVHPDDLTRVRHVVTTSQAVGTYDEEFRIVRPDKSICWIREQAFPVRNAEGKIYRIAGVARDVSQRKFAEAELRRSQEAQRQLTVQLEAEQARLIGAQAVSKSGSWEMQFPSRAMTWSKETHRIYETDPATFQPTYQAILGLIHPDDRAAVAASYSESLKHHSTAVIEHRVLLPDGRVKIVEERWQPYFDEHDQGVRAIGTCQDISRRKAEEERTRLAEAALLWKTAFLEAQVNASPDGILVVDLQGKKILQNQRMVEMLAIPPAIANDSDDARQRAWFMEMIKFPQPFVDKVAYLMAHPQEVSRDEVELKNGATFDRYSSPVLGKDGNSYGRIWTFRDITERKRIEDRLRQSQKMEAVGTLAGGIAHDFNNILAAIEGYTELAQINLRDDPKVSGYLAGVLRATCRATDLIQQILAFSRQRRLERQPTNLIAVVNDGLKLLRAAIPSTIVFETLVAADTPTVLADANQIQQVLTNLGSNAMQAMKGKLGRLQVKLERCLVDEAQATSQPQLRPGLYARLTVGDTGCGMDAATRRQMFDPFFTTKPPGEGTGLGLAVVHGIMDSHEAVITVSSQLGKGTVFQLYFPAHYGPQLVAKANETATPRGRGERILVVDDEEVLAALFQETLTSLGYVAEVATQPEQALALVRAEPQRFALVLTDQTMPGMTGLFLARQLLEIRPGLKIILMTGYSLDLTAARAQAEGLCQLLSKPLSVNTLGTAVHAALAERSAP